MGPGSVPQGFPPAGKGAGLGRPAREGRQRLVSGGRKGPRWTPANMVTCIRVVLVPLWLLVAELAVPSDGTFLSVSGLASALFFIALSLTDKLDGYLARSRGEVTTFGKFLDPIADKLLVVVALCYLLEGGWVDAWMVLLVVAREFLVSGLRMVVASKGVVVAASNLGKWKTAATMVALSGLLLAICLSGASGPWSVVSAVLEWVSYAALYLALALTAWSGVDYFVKCWGYLADEEE